jgi:hypothetical protein
MIHKGAQRITQLHKYYTINHNQTYSTSNPYNLEDSKPLLTTGSAIMIVVYFAKVSTLYPHVVISLLYRWLENLFFIIIYTSFGV